MSPYVGQALFSAAAIQSFWIKYSLITPCVNAYIFSHPTVMVMEDFSLMQRYINSQYSVFVDPTQAYANNSFQEKKQIASVLFSLSFLGGEMFCASACVHFFLVSV